MSLRILSAALLLPLVACDGGLDAQNGGRADAENDEQSWWWYWGDSSDDEEEEEDVFEPAEPGDPQWFDAYIQDDGTYVVSDSFDPVNYLGQAFTLCDEAMGTEEAPRLNLIWFTNERVYADEWRSSQADWKYLFLVQDPDDLWGYTNIECTVHVNGGTVELDTGFEQDSRMSKPWEEWVGHIQYGIDHALDERGSWNHVTRGGIQWRFGWSSTPEVFLTDDEWNDWESWSAVTGEEN
jgi:hypothetical protein